MGQISSAPVELIRVQRGGGKAWKGAVAEMQGWRADHEDAHFMKDEAEGGGCHAIFGVLDGHGGSEVARFAAHEHLPEALRRAADGASTEEALDRDVAASFVETDAWLRENAEVTRGQSGSTCVVAGIRRRRDNNVYEAFIANAGDSRGLIVRRRPGVEVLAASDDHKPDRHDEHARIAAAGGYVSDANTAKKNSPLVGALANVVARLDGNLAVSRGLGDFAYKRDSRRAPKEQKVSCVPEIYRIDSSKAPLEAGDLLILACDGIFDVMTNEDLANRVSEGLERGLDLGDICAETLTACLRELNSKDNMTLMVVEIAVDGTDYSSKVDEILGVDMYDSQNDSAVRKSFISFLQYCDTDEDRSLPNDAQELLRRAARDGQSDDENDDVNPRYHNAFTAARQRRLIIEDDDDELEDGGSSSAGTTSDGQDSFYDRH